MGELTSVAKFCLALNKLKPFLAIISLQFGYAGMYIVSMVSLNHGMNHFILATYRHVVATLVIAPFALILERKTRPKLTLPIFLRITILAFLEPVLDQNLYYMGMKKTSATFASASVNVLPAVTFILAIIFRLESVNVKKIRSLAKVIGTAITVTGAMVMTIYKGPVVDFMHPRGAGHHETSSESGNKHWIAGTLMLLGGCCAWAGFFILQSFTLRMYPAELSLSALICFMGVVEGAIVSLIFERDMSVWKIGFDSSLLAATYSGVICSGIAFYVQGAVSKAKGPVFVTSFSPLCMVITAVLGAIILAEQIHLGSILGAIVIVLGLYTVVWGKTKDPPSTETDKTAAQELPITSKSINVDDNNTAGPNGLLKIQAKSTLTRGT